MRENLYLANETHARDLKLRRNHLPKKLFYSIHSYIFFEHIVYIPIYMQNLRYVKFVAKYNFIL